MRSGSKGGGIGDSQVQEIIFFITILKKTIKGYVMRDFTFLSRQHFFLAKEEEWQVSIFESASRMIPDFLLDTLCDDMNITFLIDNESKTMIMFVLNILIER